MARYKALLTVEVEFEDHLLEILDPVIDIANKFAHPPLPDGVVIRKAEYEVFPLDVSEEEKIRRTIKGSGGYNP